MTKVTGIPVQSTIQPWKVGSPAVTREILEIDGDYAKVRVGDKEYSTKDEGYTNFGGDEVALTINDVLAEVLGDEYSGYVHNYGFTNGHVDETAETGKFCG